MILNRSAGHADAMIRFQAPADVGNLCLPVFDHLRFVENHHVPFAQSEQRCVALQQWIGGEDDIDVIEFALASKSIVIAQTHHSQVRHHALSFLNPVGQNTGRANNQAGALQMVALVLHLDVRQRFDSLAQPHVVCKYPADVMRGDKLQPCDTLFLVIAKGDAEFSRCGMRGPVCSCLQQRSRQGAQTVTALEGDRLFGPEQLHQLSGANRHASFAIYRTFIENFDQSFDQRLDAWKRQRKFGAISHGDIESAALIHRLQKIVVDDIHRFKSGAGVGHIIRNAAHRLHKQRQQRNFFTPDIDAQVDAEPSFFLDNISLPVVIIWHNDTIVKGLVINNVPTKLFEPRNFQGNKISQLTQLRQYQAEPVIYAREVGHGQLQFFGEHRTELSLCFHVAAVNDGARGTVDGDMVAAVCGIAALVAVLHPVKGVSCIFLHAVVEFCEKQYRRRHRFSMFDDDLF